MKSNLVILIGALLIFSCSCHRQLSSRRARSPLPSVASGRIEDSPLTLPGAKPFHLKASVVEATNLMNESYNAEIEEYWLTPDKWRRTVKAEGFSSDLVVNREKTTESVTGDYYPNWLRTFVTAIFDPSDPIRNLDLNAPYDNPMPGSGLKCRRFSSRVGVFPTQNSIFFTVCFDGERLQSVGMPGYQAEYTSYKDFNGKQVARNIREYIESGTELEARITDLTELKAVDEDIMAIRQPSSTPIRTVILSEDELRRLAISSLEMTWPPITGGKPQGVLSIYVCLDRGGRVRETYALNSDHPEMADAARQQLEEVKFTPPTFESQPVQAEGILTFAYKTEIQHR